MHSTITNGNLGALGTLRQFVRKPTERTERCELCAGALSSSHQHLLELEKRQITCACDPCAILFAGAARQRYKRIPRDVQWLQDFAMDRQEWESLLIPINLAFFVHVSQVGRTVAQYPSPGGAMESSLDLEYWNVIVDRNPEVKQFEPDVEALLVNRLADSPHYYRAPIDHCFRLVGIMRKHWRGLSGGTEVWREIDRFFGELRELSSGAQGA